MGVCACWHAGSIVLWHQRVVRWYADAMPVAPTEQEEGFLAMECVQQPAAAAAGAAPLPPLHTTQTQQAAVGHTPSTPEAAASSRADAAQQDILDISSEDSDEACLAVEAGHDAGVLLLQYHIVYHTTYQVPALCFRATTAGGAQQVFVSLHGGCVSVCCRQLQQHRLYT